MIAARPPRFTRPLLSRFPALALALLLSAPIQPATAAAPKAIDGLWQGTLKISGVELRLLFRIAHDERQKLSASLDSIDQGAKGIPVDEVTIDGDDVAIAVKRIQGSYSGKLGDDRRTIRGTWKQAGNELPLDLELLDREPAAARPQEPKKPYPYLEEEVAYASGPRGEIKLAATLTRPKTDRPVPAVVLITGSGPQDRDETVAGHRPFLVLADYLTRRGIAVLRSDDRGVGGSTGDTSSATTSDVANDALAGVAYLKTRPEIDARRIGLLGHSEGGIAAPLAASRAGDVRFVVMLAGTGVTGDEILYRQAELMAKVLGIEAADVAAGNEFNRRIYQVIVEEPDNARAEAKIREIVATLPAGSLTDQIKTQTESSLKMVLSPWFRFFLTHDPLTVLRRIRCPVLVLNGEKDWQVDPKQNLPPIEAALKEAAHPDYTVKELPGLNHLFQHCETGSPTEYSKIEETISPEVLELIGDWIVERTK